MCVCVATLKYSNFNIILRDTNVCTVRVCTHPPDTGRTNNGGISRRMCKCARCGRVAHGRGGCGSGVAGGHSFGRSTCGELECVYSICIIYREHVCMCLALWRPVRRCFGCSEYNPGLYSETIAPLSLCVRRRYLSLSCHVATVLYAKLPACRD